MGRASVAILCVLFISTACGLHISPGDLDPLDTLDEDDFEEVFHELPAEDPTEEKHREEALLINEALVKETNEAFLAGNISWFDAINEFSNLPEEEFEKLKTGALVPGHAKGLLLPPLEDRYDSLSERFFDKFRQSPIDVPASYSSVDLGLVSPVKNQDRCGSCTAFASMGAVEVCYAKLTGQIGDYAEQQFLDCGYDNKLAYGCNGAYIEAYFNWATRNQEILAGETQYPYLNANPKLVCPDPPLPVMDLGARTNSTYHTYEGDETLMKQFVYTHGAVVSTVRATKAFDVYKGGVFAGCSPDESHPQDHAILVVGYGTTPEGEDYWLIKNSWDSDWGENGYIRLKRGVGMCGIAEHMSIITCAPTGTEPLTTEPPTTEPPTTEPPTTEPLTTEPPATSESEYDAATSESEYDAATSESEYDAATSESEYDAATSESEYDAATSESEYE